MVKNEGQSVVGCEPCQIFARVIGDSKPVFPCPECGNPLVYYDLEEFVKTHTLWFQEQERKEKLRIEAQKKRKIQKLIMRMLENGQQNKLG